MEDHGPPKLSPGELEQQIMELWEADNPEMEEDEGNEPKPDVTAWYLKYDNLEFGKRIDKGSYGAVYQGMYEGTEVAIKEITALDTQEDLFYIDREVKALVRACHPNIVNFIGVCKHKRNLYIITEFVQGGNLRQWLRKKEFPFPWKLRVKACLQTARALVYLQKRGMVHRDIKTKNLLIYAEEWNVKLCDFGFARMAAAPGRPMTICGTQAYMAPEIVAGKSHYDVRADVYSFGVCIAEVIARFTPEEGLTNKVPPGGLNFPLFDQLAPDECPPVFFKLAVSCCASEPSHRPSFEEIVHQLEQLDKELQAPSVGQGITFSVKEMGLGEVLGHGIGGGLVRKGVLKGMPIVAKAIPVREVDDVQMVRYEKDKHALIVLRSPNLAQYLGTCQDEEFLYLVSECVQGQTLASILKSHISTQIPWQVRYQLALDTTRALHYLHSKGVLHRNIKPSNLIVEPNGHVKVCDFGTARPAPSQRLAWNSSVYHAPELSKGSIFHRPSDVFSFGVLLGYLITFVDPLQWMVLEAVDGDGKDGDEERKEKERESKERTQSHSASTLGRVLRAATGSANRSPISAGVAPPPLRGDNDFNKRVFSEEIFLKVVPRECPKVLITLVLSCLDPQPQRRPTFQTLLEKFVNLSGAHPVEDGMIDSLFAEQMSSRSGSLQSLSSEGAISALDDLLGDIQLKSIQQHGRFMAKRPMSVYNKHASSRARVIPEEGSGQPGPSNQSEADGTTLFRTHLDKLVRRATHELYPEPDYARDMLLVFPSFSTSSDMLASLVRRFENIDAEQDGSDDDRSKQIVSLRIVNFLKRWITEFPSDMEDMSQTSGILLKDAIRSFVNEKLTCTPSVEAFARRLNELLDAGTKSTPAPSSDATVPQTRNKSGSLITEPSSSMTFLTVHATELARQITVLDSEIYRSMNPREVLSVVMKLGDPTASPSVFKADRRFSELSNWVSREILNHQDLKQRVSVVARFIETAEQLRLLKNFGSLFAVMFGLLHPAIQRLNVTWKNLPRLAVRRLTKLRVLLASGSGNDFKAYRDAFAKASAPMLPYLDILIQELDEVNKSEPTTLPNGLINFKKLRTISEKVCLSLNGARGNYEVVDDPLLRHFLLCSLADDSSDSDLRRMSMLCE